MSQVLEVEGKSIDEAIFSGLEQMGLSFDEVDIEILQENSKGFLGIGKSLAKVRLTKREGNPTAWDNEPAKETPRQAKPEAAPQPAKQEKPRREVPQRTAKPEPAPKKEIIGTPVSADEPAIAFLSGILRDMGIECGIKAVRNEDGLFIDISGEGMGRIIGYRGETLDAIQYLTSLVENKDSEEYTRVTIDTENYRQKREMTLIRLAERLAQKAIKSGRRVSLDPMNPAERRIIHSALQGVSGVTTASEGEDPNRRVVITPVRR